MARTITPSTGNVFRDLRLPPAEATRLLIRADLLIEIERIAKTRRLTDAALARVLRVGRRRVDELRRGRLRRFSTDTFIDMLSRLGVDVRLVVKATKQRRLPRDRRARTKALGRLRRLRRPMPSDFDFDRDVINQR